MRLSLLEPEPQAGGNNVTAARGGVMGKKNVRENSRFGPASAMAVGRSHDEMVEGGNT